MAEWQVKVVYIVEGKRYEEQTVVGTEGRQKIEAFLMDRDSGREKERGDMFYFAASDQGLHGYKTNQIIAITMKGVD